MKKIGIIDYFIDEWHSNNLVKMMMEGRGIEVIDLGTDVSPEEFVNTAIEKNCGIICCSALLTTTMNVMEDVVKAAERAGVRDRIKIMMKTEKLKTR